MLPALCMTHPKNGILHSQVSQDCTDVVIHLLLYVEVYYFLYRRLNHTDE